MAERVTEVERLMREGMREVVPGMLVRVETVVTRSPHKGDLGPRYALHTQDREVAAEVACCTAA